MRPRTTRRPSSCSVASVTASTAASNASALWAAGRAHARDLADVLQGRRPHVLGTDLVGVRRAKGLDAPAHVADRTPAGKAEAMSAPVVVVGGGHNGLVAACYLARAGRRVVVLEASDRLGGGSRTEELLPGHRFDTHSAAHNIINMTSIPEELDLAGAGLDYLPMDPFATGHFADGRAVRFYRDVERTVASIAEHDRAEAEAYRAFLHRAMPLVRTAVTGLDTGGASKLACAPPTAAGHPALGRAARAGARPRHAVRRAARARPAVRPDARTGRRLREPQLRRAAPSRRRVLRAVAGGLPPVRAVARARRVAVARRRARAAAAVVGRRGAHGRCGRPRRGARRAGPRGRARGR